MVCNYSALAPTTEYLQRRYMEFILWWYVITPPSHLRQSIYGGVSTAEIYGLYIWWYEITSPSHLRKRRYNGNLVYILWRCSNFFAIALTTEGTYYGGIGPSPLSHIRHGGDQNTAKVQSYLCVSNESSPSSEIIVWHGKRKRVRGKASNLIEIQRMDPLRIATWRIFP